MTDAAANPVGSWREEMRAAHLYVTLAEIERGTQRAQLFASLAGEARAQAAIWAEAAKSAGMAVPEPYAPDLRARLVASLARRYGPRNIRGVLAAMKVRGLSVYSHAQPGHPAPTSIEDMAKRHRGLAAGGNLRAAVFGVNDGLVSNASLILGVAAAAASNEVILLTGVAGLLAGAFSMAAGEWVSVRSQREMFEYPDRPRARGARPVPGRGGPGARARLRGARAAEGAGCGARGEHRRESRGGA